MRLAMTNCVNQKSRKLAIVWDFTENSMKSTKGNKINMFRKGERHGLRRLRSFDLVRTTAHSA